jgi:lysophospholipase L1-like esterase
MYKKIIWFSLLTLAVICSFIFISGFILSLSITNSKTATNNSKIETNIPINNKTSLPSSSNSYNILVMGDSLAKATGDEKGLGFINDFVNLQKLKTTKNVNVDNIAVNGDKSIDLLRVIENKAAWQTIENSKIIFISIGGNELKQFKSTEVSVASVKNIENTYLENLKSIYKLIRNKNASCTIVFIGLYNPFDKDLTPEKLALLNTWNYDTQQLLANDVNSLFIPTYDLFKYNLHTYLALDKFHPNSAGYEAISKRVAEALKNY